MHTIHNTGVASQIGAYSDAIEVEAGRVFLSVLVSPEDDDHGQ